MKMQALLLFELRQKQLSVLARLLKTVAGPEIFKEKLAYYFGISLYHTYLIVCITHNYVVLGIPLRGLLSASA